MESDIVDRQQQWIADNDEKVQATLAPTILPQQPEPIQKQQAIDDSQTKQPLSQIQASPLRKNTETLQGQLVQNICIDNAEVVLVGYFGRKVEIMGRIKVSNLRVVFVIQKNGEEEPFLDVPIGYLLRAERVQDKMYAYVEIYLKYGVSVKVKYPDSKNDFSAKTQRLIAHLIESSSQIPFDYGSQCPSHLKYLPYTPSQSLATVSDAHEYDNKNWKRLSNYPESFKVPLPYLSKNNIEDRFILLSFVYNNGKDEVAVWRTGPGRPDPTQDQWMARAKASPKLVTIQIKNKGIGSSRSLALKVVQLQSLIHLRESFFSIYRLAVNNHDSLKWLPHFLSTKWYEQIGTLLQEASSLVNQLSNHSAHVAIMADSEIRGAQIVALAQILLFPEARTVKGFGQLVQRQFLQFGSTRNSLKKEPQPDRGTGLIQFFDAVYQLTSIYPLSFQFGQDFLIFLAQQIYSSRYANFLLISKTIRQQQRQSLQKCPDIWSSLNSWLQNPELACYYLNPFYVDYKQCDIYQLKTMPSIKQLKIWGGFFFRKFRENSVDYHVFRRHQQLMLQHFKNKKETQELRKTLAAQHKMLQERKALLKDLKTFQ